MGYCAIQNTLIALTEEHGDKGSVLGMIQCPEDLSLGEKKAALGMMKLLRDNFEGWSRWDFADAIHEIEESISEEEDA